MFTEHSRVYVSRTHGLLCDYNLFLWILFSIITTYCHSNLHYSQFWSGNVLHNVCFGSAPRGMLLPRKVLNLLSSFLSLFEEVPTCISVIDFEKNLGCCLSSCLPGKQRPTVVRTFDSANYTDYRTT